MSVIQNVNIVEVRESVVGDGMVESQRHQRP